MLKDSGNILVVDDDADVLHTAQLILEPHFDKVVIAEKPELISDLMLIHDFDVIVLDMNFSFGQTSGTEGLFWLRKILTLNPEAHVLMNTAYGDIKLAVDAMKEGAIDFLVKPWEKAKLLASVQSVYELSQAKKENKNLRSKTKILSDEIDQQFPSLTSSAQSMKPVFEMINNVAETDANVLILGENGTGKEIVARMIHRKSKRNENDFINVDLGSISESLFESELFGHQKGAFTDARENRLGRFEIATKGTLFLDEIGNIALPQQAKLLAAIQNREIYRVGSSKPIKINIRLISATNKPIHQIVARDEFRQDLLYRINTVEISLPPLRQRKEDIPILAGHFLEVFKKKYQKENQYLTLDAYKKLQQYSWPGNIRELQHIIERVVILNPDEKLDTSAFSMNIMSETTSENKNFRMENLEKKNIQEVLHACDGNMSKAAKELGYARSTLYRKIVKYEL